MFGHNSEAIDAKTVFRESPKIRMAKSIDMVKARLKLGSIYDYKSNSRTDKLPFLSESCTF